jgi:hypothetical protein
MNKVKIRKKEVKKNPWIISVGYCDMQHLLRYYNPIAYSTRREGWACDYYDINHNKEHNNIIISTGYAPVDNKNTKFDYKVLREYENKAKSITYDNNIGWDEQKRLINELLNDFINNEVEKF